MSLNKILIELAQHRLQKDAGLEKSAVVPAGGGGAPPMDPAMAGGAPPMDPAMAGMAPPMPGAPMPGAPMPGAPMPGAPMDPSMGGAAPPVDPATGAPAPPKMKPEQMMQMLDFRLYNMQQQITAIMNALQVSVPPGALVTPPGSPTPVAEAAVPGGPQDPTQAPGGEEGGGQSSIPAIEPIQGASPELAMGGQKSAAAPRVGTPYGEPPSVAVGERAAATAALLRQRTARR